MKNNRKGIVNSISKRFQTTMIGCLARFEDNFGHLWNHNSDGKLTDKQEELAELWEYTRTSILNHGNNQMREAIDEIIDYIEKENELFRYHFIINNKTNKE